MKRPVSVCDPATPLKSCNEVLKFDPKVPVTEPTTGRIPPMNSNDVPLPKSARGNMPRVPAARSTLPVTSPANPTNPFVIDVDRPTGFPQFVSFVIPIRSPCCTITGGESVTVVEPPAPVSNGPCSASIVSVLPLRRKNLIFTAIEQPLPE